MASGTFEKTSWDWQIQQLQQRVGEWLERVFSSRDQDIPNLPNWAIPDWLQKILFWAIVLGLILWASWQVYQLLHPYFSNNYLKNSSSSLAANQTTELTVSEWLNRSRQAQQQGNYREACRALYLATLQHLNDKGLIHQEPSRTDGEYLGLIQGFSTSHPYCTLIHTHEQLCFSDVDISAEVFDRCWQAYREIAEERGEGRGQERQEMGR